MSNFKEVAKFASVDDAISAQIAKDKFMPRDLYPRDGSVELFEVEDRIGSLTGADNVLLYSSGMAAIRDAIEISFPTAGTRLLRGSQVYSQAGNYIDNDLRKRGVQVATVDSGNINEIDARIRSARPQIVTLETVSNGVDMPVLDVERFLNLDSVKDVDPYIILDNTLPSSCNIPLAEIIKESDRKVAVVESGTKFYSLNRELSGIVYTYNEDVFNSLQNLRRKGGTIPGPAAVSAINHLLPSREEFVMRNKAICANTFEIAKACYEASSSGGIVVSYPNLPNHENSDYANSHCPDGISPVLFIQPTDWEDDSQVKIVRRLWNDETINQYCDLGQSFGFDRARIWFDQHNPYIRVGGGSDNRTDAKKIADAFYSVLSTV